MGRGLFANSSSNSRILLANMQNMTKAAGPWSNWLLFGRTINRRLTQTNLPIYRYVAQVALISAIPVIIVTTTAVVTGQLILDPHRLLPNWRLGSPSLTLLMGVLDVVLLSPFVETGLTLVPIRLLRWVRVPERIIPMSCGLIWGLVHTNYHGALLGFIAAWPFFCFTTVLMVYEKPSIDRAWVIASSVHALNNVACLLVSLILARL